MSPAPTITPPAQKSSGVVAKTNAPVPVIPFVRASRKKSRLVTQITQALTNSVAGIAPIQLPAGGFLKKIRITVIGTTAGNSANVVFKNDAPFSVLSQIQLLSPNGDTLINTIEGFTLAMLLKYGAFSSGRFDPLSNPNYSATTGAGATGGSFQFELEIPVEIDARDAFCTLQNMAANQSYLLNMSLNASTAVYSTAPTNQPSIAITMTMDYWSAPAQQNNDGVLQQTFPTGNGSVSLIQTQTPAIVASTQQNIPLLNVGNTIRFIMLILRDSSGVRTETDFPTVSNLYVNNDPYLYKTKAQWRSQMAREYGLTAGLSATPAINTLDNGVYIITDFFNDGSSGDMKVDATANRDLLLVTASTTALNYEAVSWGSGASSLLVVENVIRPISAQALYAPMFI